MRSGYQRFKTILNLPICFQEHQKEGFIGQKFSSHNLKIKAIEGFQRGANVGSAVITAPSIKTGDQLFGNTGAVAGLFASLPLSTGLSLIAAPTLCLYESVKYPLALTLHFFKENRDQKKPDRVEEDLFFKDYY